jgi:hypothetical protein
MPTAYLKKLAKLNHTTVNKLEKFWSQAKEIAKSEGQGKAWGLITTIFQNKLKKEGYKIKAITYTSLNFPESTKKFYEDLENELKEYRKCTAFKEEIRKSDSGQIFKFQRLSLSSIQKLLKYYLEDNEFDSTTHWNDLYSDSDGIVYIEYDGNKTFYSVTNPLLKDLNTSNIRNCIIEYPDYTAYFGKDCRIEKFDGKEDAPYVIKCEAKMNKYAYKGQVITASSREEAIQKVVADIKMTEDYFKKCLIKEINKKLRVKTKNDGSYININEYRINILVSHTEKSTYYPEEYLSIIVEYPRSKKPDSDTNEKEFYCYMTKESFNKCINNVINFINKIKKPYINKSIKEAVDKKGDFDKEEYSLWLYNVVNLMNDMTDNQVNYEYSFFNNKKSVKEVFKKYKSNIGAAARYLLHKYPI